MKDLTNQRFGRLIALERDKTKKRSYWICQCDCGNKISVRSDHLTSGKIQSCKCLHKEVVSKNFSKDITNKKFGYLTAIKPLYVNNHGETVWLCECALCGGIKEVPIGYLTSGSTTSCGCLMSRGEQKIKQILDENKINYEKEFSFNELFDVLPLRFDFAIFNNNNNNNNDLISLIEYNGEQHYDNKSYFCNKSLIRHDKMKQNFCLKNKINLVIIPYTDFNKINFNYLKEKGAI